MKRLKENQLGSWCDFCPIKTVRAVWRTKSGTDVTYSCENHIDELKEKVRTGFYVRHTG